MEIQNTDENLSSMFSSALPSLKINSEMNPAQKEHLEAKRVELQMNIKRINSVGGDDLLKHNP